MIFLNGWVLPIGGSAVKGLQSTGPHRLVFFLFIAMVILSAWSRDSMSPVCRIFFIVLNFLNLIFLILIFFNLFEYLF